MRRLRPLDVPLHVAAEEYASVKTQLGEHGMLRQAIEFFLHNSIRPDMQRMVGQVVEEFIAAREANGLGRTYIDDAMWRIDFPPFGMATQDQAIEDQLMTDRKPQTTCASRRASSTTGG